MIDALVALHRAFLVCDRPEDAPLGERVLDGLDVVVEVGSLAAGRVQTQLYPQRESSLLVGRASAAALAAAA
jgi:hypothetical protein